jgi:hypothetical protein
MLSFLQLISAETQKSISMEQWDMAIDQLRIMNHKRTITETTGDEFMSAIWILDSGLLVSFLSDMIG